MKTKAIFHKLGLTWQDLVIAVLTIVSFLVFIPIFTYVYFARALTSKDSIMDLKDTGVILLDDKNQPFFTFYQGKYKSFVPLSEIPKITQEAVLSSEDKNFYNHPGFSPGAIIRSLFSDIKEGSLAYGGSTITQQLVKNSLLNSHKDFLRKYQEIVLAQEIERRYSKQEILEMYLNSVYFGQGSFGIEEAAQTYFGKDVKDLDIAQSSLLAALLPAPSSLDPFSGNENEAIIHQRIILQKMLSQKYISSDDEKKAEEEKLDFTKPQADLNSLAPHFALLVRDQLIQKYGEEVIQRSGYKVHTTLNSDWQKYAEGVVKKQVENLAHDNVSNGAAVAIDPKTGEVKALVGSADWYNDKFGKFDIALAARQPGSSFKPIYYSKALEERLITPATILQDVPTTFDNCPGADPIAKKDPRCQYKPLDFDRRFRGPVTVRRALSNSLNIPSVAVFSKVGVSGALEVAKRLGLTTLDDPSNYGLSLGLGAGEVRLIDMTDAYAAFANKGVRNPPVTIVSIEDKYGQKIYDYSPSPDQVMGEDVAFLISSILSDNIARAEEFGNTLTISRPAAVKTGTTENFKDAWTLGYTPQLAVGVWVGNNDGTPMDQIAGALGAAPIWRSLMEKFLEGTSIEKFVQPEGVVATNACKIIKSDDKEASMSDYREYFLEGTQSSQACKPPQSPPLPGASSPGSPAPSTQTPSPVTFQSAPAPQIVLAKNGRGKRH